MFLYFDILTLLTILNFGSSSLISLLESIYVLDFTSTDFFLIILSYVLLCLLTISSNLSIYTFFDTENFICVCNVFVNVFVNFIL